MSSHLTRLSAVTENGELLLETEDPSVRHKAAAAGDKILSFVYRAGEVEETANGRVTSVLDGSPYRFTLLPEEATLGP